MNFDINDIDFENMGIWPKSVKAIALVLLTVLVAGVGYWFVVKDQLSNLQSLASQEHELKQKFEIKQRKASNLVAYKKQVEEMEISLGALLRQLPGETEVPGLLDDVTHTGLKSGLSFNLIQLETEIVKEFYAELPISVEVNAGNYHQLGQFVSDVAALSRIVTLHDFSLEPVKNSTDQNTLNLKILAKTYRYTDEEEG